MAVETYLPSLITIITTATIDSINPCAIGVIILMISVLLAARQSIKKVLFLGSIYIISVYIVYFLAGLGLTYYFSTLPLYLTEYIAIAVASLIIIGGILEIKDYFWYGRWFSLSIPHGLSKKIHKYATKTTIVGVILLGAFVSGVELPCTGGPYLAIITLLSQNFNTTAFFLLVIYNIIFVLPLIVILLMVVLGMKLHKIKRWKQGARPYTRLLIGLLLIGLGWLLMLIANGTVNLG
ncbi:hypothetical protein HYU50_01970 [Candidatus Woesearchaeota archaeon]|nr:hypothetical protein [Candidatus Woesearchaeota archaeon]